MNKAIQIAYDEQFELKCRLASEAGFRHISVNFDAAKELSDEAWEKAPAHIASVLEKNALAVVQTHLPYYDLRISAEIFDDKMEKAIRNSIRTGSMVGAPWHVWHPRSAISDGWSVSSAQRINFETVSGYLALAREYGAGIALENLPTFSGIRPIMPFYTSNYPDLIDLCDRFDTPDVGICWDFGHANLMHLDQAAALQAIGSRVVCTHIHNNFRDDDQHLPPDQGNINWSRALSAMADIGYTGPLTLETHCLYHDEGLLASFARHNFAALVYLESLMKKEGSTK